MPIIIIKIFTLTRVCSLRLFSNSLILRRNSPTSSLCSVIVVFIVMFFSPGSLYSPTICHEIIKDNYLCCLSLTLGTNTRARIMVVPSKNPIPSTAGYAFTKSIRVYVETMLTANTILVI